MNEKLDIIVLILQIVKLKLLKNLLMLFEKIDLILIDFEKNKLKIFMSYDL
jgi:predicted O-methyltransferase YrrM